MENAHVCFYQSTYLSSHSDAPLICRTIYSTSLNSPCIHKHISYLLNSSELWHQHLGHPGMHQLQHLQRYTTGIPTGLHQQVHLLHHYNICSDAQACKSPIVPTTSVDHLAPGSCFPLDFGFMCASSQISWCHQSCQLI